jgi:glutamyl-tRNA synthetase
MPETSAPEGTPSNLPRRPVRVRFAPSPTGLLHIGGLRTALYNWLFARQHGGTFILRIEDTDQVRHVEEAESDILDSLAWAGLDYDEGPGKGGPHEPYYQSQRGELYRAAAERLITAGRAYYAFDTPEEIEAMRDRLQQAGDAAPKYDAVTRTSMTNSLTLSTDEVSRRIAAGEEYVVRLNVPAGETVRFEDLVRGWVTFDTAGIDDQVLLKSDGLPTYHLANVVDDHEMDITHVIRGEEWLPSVPKHLLLYEFFGWEPPRMAHLPLILSPAGGKLSKRNAEKMGIPVSVRQYREEGYEPDALLNFLAFLGWNPGTDQELFTLDELIDAYSIERTAHSGAQFNLEKLRWYNGQYIRMKSVEQLADEVRPHLEREGLPYDDDTLRQVIALLQERVEFVHEVATTGAFFFQDPTSYDEKGVSKNWKAESAHLVRAYADRLAVLDDFSVATTEAELRALAEERGVGAGKIIHPVRLAVSGVSAGPSLFEMLVALGHETTVRRLRRAADVLG